MVLDGRSLNEVLSRPTTPRTVIRAGRVVDGIPPDYRELDALVG